MEKKAESCPKCKGNIFIEWDHSDGAWYEYCLQCSYRHYLPVMAKTEPGKEAAVASKQSLKGRRNAKDN